MDVCMIVLNPFAVVDAEQRGIVLTHIGHLKQLSLLQHLKHLIPK